MTCFEGYVLYLEIYGSCLSGLMTKGSSDIDMSLFLCKKRIRKGEKVIDEKLANVDHLMVLEMINENIKKNDFWESGVLHLQKINILRI